MTFKRRREQKTDYVQRFALLKSSKARLVIRRSLNSFHIQIISGENGLDKTIVETDSKALRKYGWKGHCGNLPAAYLTGYLAGILAQKNNIKDAIVDLGLQKTVKTSGLYAAAAGAKDSGLSVPVGKDALPKMERIKGQHIADYAKKLKDTDAYKKQFSAYLKTGLQPEDVPKHFDEVKGKILSEIPKKIAAQ